jgi:hypothetical protein
MGFRFLRGFGLGGGGGGFRGAMMDQLPCPRRAATEFTEQDGERGSNAMSSKATRDGWRWLVVGVDGCRWGVWCCYKHDENGGIRRALAKVILAWIEMRPQFLEAGIFF